MSESMDNQSKLKASLSPEGKISRRELLKLAVPFGNITVDGLQCTGCGLCALDCATGALAFSCNNETGTYQLLFRHASCFACGQCVEACPEKCLQLERLLKLDNMNSPVVLFEDTIVRCLRCGKPVAPRAMIDRLRAKVSAAGCSVQLELCPGCKVEDLKR